MVYMPGLQKMTNRRLLVKVGDLVRYGSSTGVVLNKKILEHFDDDGSLFYHKSL